jgi:hypothetical protein
VRRRIFKEETMATDRKPEDTVQAATAAVDEATRAVNEAARTATEASRRSADRQAEAAVQIARAYQDELSEASRRIAGAWTSGLEARWGGAFEAQRAWYSAGLALLDAGVRWNRIVLEQWSETTRLSMIEPLQVWGRAAERLAEDARPTRERAR